MWKSSSFIIWLFQGEDVSQVLGLLGGDNLEQQLHRVKGSKLVNRELLGFFQQVLGGFIPILSSCLYSQHLILKYLELPAVFFGKGNEPS